MGCIFCKIITGELPAEKIYEDDRVLVFLDINPVSEGHALLIPKEHHALMPDVPDELLGYCFAKVKKLMQNIKIAMQADYVSVSVSGVDIPHFHIHIIPRNFSDRLQGWPTKKYAEEKMHETAEKIKKLIL
jgi:histidine triad (HIT) family protein